MLLIALMGSEYKGCGMHEPRCDVTYYSGIRLEELRKTKNDFNWDNLCSGQDSNSNLVILVENVTV